MTPVIPDEIRKIRHLGYKNIFEIIPENKRLYGTESLMGDWNGHGLILAQDFAPVEYVLQHGYVHSPNFPTNKNLLSILKSCGHDILGLGNLNCGFLYGSACFLLKDTKSATDSLPEKRVALLKSELVFEFVLDNMPKLKFIICTGRIATDFAARFFVGNRNKNVTLENDLAVSVKFKGRDIALYPTPHPGGLGLAQMKLAPGDSRTRLQKLTDQWKGFLESQRTK